MSSNPDPKQMKSHLLQFLSDDPESLGAKKLQRHLRDLLVGLDDAMRDKCMAKLGEARKLRTKHAKAALIKSVASGDVAKGTRVEHALSTLSFFVDALLRDNIPDDDYLLWSKDLETLGFIDQDARLIFESLINRLANEYLPMLQDLEWQQRAESGVLPNFKSLGITVEARAVRKNRYHWGMPLEGKDAYHPEITGTAMIASISIGVDEGFPKDFYFQVDEAQIDQLASSLTAAKREMAALRDYLNLDTEGKVKGDA